MNYTIRCVIHRLQIYDYYVTRAKNPLKRRQAMVAVSCKLIRVFYTILTKGVDYDRVKMISDIQRERTSGRLKQQEL